MNTRELTTDLEMLDRLTQPAGKDVVDVVAGVRACAAWPNTIELRL